jgi:hypothetical protein
MQVNKTIKRGHKAILILFGTPYLFAREDTTTERFDEMRDRGLFTSEGEEVGWEWRLGWFDLIRIGVLQEKGMEKS